MKHLGIVCAIQREAQPIIEHFKLLKFESAPFAVYRGYLGQIKITLTICGLGKVVASMVTQELITSYKVDEIVNLGICGAISDDLELGAVIYSNQFVQHDFCIDAPNKHSFWIPSIDSHLIETEVPDLYDLFIKNSTLKSGVMCSGDRFIKSRDVKLALVKSSSAITCDMESAAIAHVCYLLKSPFLSIRAVSDLAEDIPSNFEDNMALAIKNVSSVFIDALCSTMEFA
jgi:adenosylhomocysteine nucleosidase